MPLPLAVCGFSELGTYGYGSAPTSSPFAGTNLVTCKIRVQFSYSKVAVKWTQYLTMQMHIQCIGKPVTKKLQYKGKFRMFYSITKLQYNILIPV